VASVVEESSVPPLPKTITAVEEERTAMETAAAKASLEPPIGASSGWCRRGGRGLGRGLGASPTFGGS
jgi:hypothetical protein